jgi:hypothetical protein
MLYSRTGERTRNHLACWPGRVRVVVWSTITPEKLEQVIKRNKPRCFLEEMELNT